MKNIIFEQWKKELEEAANASLTRKSKDPIVAELQTTSNRARRQKNVKRRPAFHVKIANVAFALFQKGRVSATTKEIAELLSLYVGTSNMKKAVCKDVARNIRKASYLGWRNAEGGAFVPVNAKYFNSDGIFRSEKEASKVLGHVGGIAGLVFPRRLYDWLVLADMRHSSLRYLGGLETLSKLQHHYDREHLSKTIAETEEVKKQMQRLDRMAKERAEMDSLGEEGWVWPPATK